MPSPIINIKDLKVRTGILVKRLRKSQHLSQEELANKLGVSRMTIQKLESGSNATMDTLLKVFQYLNLLEAFSELIENEMRNQSYASLY